MMSQPWKLVLLLAGIFLAGGVTGAFVGQKVLQAKMSRRPMPEHWAPRHLKRLAEQLELKPEQQEELRPIIKRNMDELNHLRTTAMTATKVILERMEREVSEKLTPEQRAKFEKQNQEFREKMRKFGADRLGGPRGERGGPDKPPGDKPPTDKPN